MSSADLDQSGDQNQVTPNLNRQITRANQCSVVNSNTIRHRLDRTAGWVARKVSLADNVLTRYRSHDTATDGNALLLASVLNNKNENFTSDQDIPYKTSLNAINKNDGQFSVNHNHSSGLVQRAADTQNNSTENTLSQSRGNDLTSPLQRITARENRSGIIDGTQIRHKFDKTMNIPATRITSVDRLLQRAASTDKSDIPAVAMSLPTRQSQESTPLFRKQDQGQSKENIATKANFTGGNTDNKTQSVNSSLSEKNKSYHVNCMPISNESILNETESNSHLNREGDSFSPELKTNGKSETSLVFRHIDKSDFDSGIASSKPVFATQLEETAGSKTNNTITKSAGQSQNGSDSKSSINHSEHVNRSPFSNESFLNKTESISRSSELNNSVSPEITTIRKSEGSLVFRQIAKSDLDSGTISGKPGISAQSEEPVVSKTNVNQSERVLRSPDRIESSSEVVHPVSQSNKVTDSISSEIKTSGKSETPLLSRYAEESSSAQSITGSESPLVFRSRDLSVHDNNETNEQTIKPFFNNSSQFQPPVNTIPSDGHEIAMRRTNTEESIKESLIAPTGYNRKSIATQKPPQIIARSKAEQGSTDSSQQKATDNTLHSNTNNSVQQLLFRKISSNVISKNTGAGSVAPAIATTQSQPAEFVWRKSDSTAHLQTNTGANSVTGGIKSAPGQPILSRKTDVPESGGSQSAQSDTGSGNGASKVQNPVIDIEVIAEQIERLLSRRMTIERERRGECQ